MDEPLLPTALQPEVLARHPVVLVDDDVVNRMVAEAVLSTQFRVHVLETPRDVMRVLDEGDVSVLVADYRMPQMDGVELCAWARRAHPSVQRILLTAYTDPSVTVEAINRGAVSRFLVKPCPNDTLITAVSEAVARAELERSLRELQVSLQRSERAAAVAALHGLILHDLANVTTGLTCSLGLIARWLEARDDVPAEIRGDLEQAEEAVRALQAIHARARMSHPKDPQRGALRLAEAIQTAVILIRGQALGRVQFQVECPEDLVVLTDPIDLSRVLVNLLSNAVQALLEAKRQDGRIHLRVLTSGPHARIEVADNGPGIPVAIQAGVFERGWTSRRAAGGSGLGLAICRELVTANGGDVALASSTDAGSTFVVELPLATKEN